MFNNLFFNEENSELKAHEMGSDKCYIEGSDLHIYVFQA